MRYTDQGGAALDAYVARVRRALAGNSEVDPDEVVAGIREHVEAALTDAGVEPATTEDVLEVLARLGPPESLADGDDTRARASTSPVGSYAIWGAIAMAVLGIALVPTRLMPVGLGLVTVALVGSRVVLAEPAVSGTLAGRLATLLWQVGAAVAVLALLLAPAALVWAWAQTGGPLERVLAQYAGVSGSARPGGYWLAMALLAVGVTGAWWIGVGAIVHPTRAVLRRALGPASDLLPDRAGRGLALIGTALLLVSVAGALLS